MGICSQQLSNLCCYRDAFPLLSETVVYQFTCYRGQATWSVCNPHYRLVLIADLAQGLQTPHLLGGGLRSLVE